MLKFKISRSLSMVLILLGLSIFGLMVTGQVVFSRLSYFFAFLIVLAWLWSRSSLLGLDVRRIPYLKRGQVGQIFKEGLEIHNASRIFKLWVELEDLSALPGSKWSRVHVLVPGRHSLSFLSRTRLVKRGVFQLGPSVLHGGDPFGFFKLSREVPASHSLMVLPLMVDVYRFPSPPGILPGGEALRRRTHQVTPNASNVRDYAPGDGLNRIHWKSSARRNQLIVKEFELDPLAEIWLFADADMQVQVQQSFEGKADVEDIFSSRPEKYELAPDTLDYTASVVASIARYFIQQGRSTGLAVNGESLEVLMPDKTGRQLDKILEAMALLVPEASFPFASVVVNQCRHLARGSTVILVTASGSHEIASAAVMLTRLGLRPIVILLNAESFGGQAGSETLAKELQKLNISTALIAYQDDLALRLNSLVQVLRL